MGTAVISCSRLGSASCMCFAILEEEGGEGPGDVSHHFKTGACSTVAGGDFGKATASEGRRQDDEDDC